eukprot:gnl/TRDRNA2_/TRDRNA2_83156_c0_seq1.p2 gnl/TRDRNA2_/TRDRNA2_83156_c0~~gnl/TRDRNA2_/TRDRNA2_83156_c0_seq1.p2  ORF type:complete len:414 (-),score=87.37 gnl/TRDRNA2_/TRDRNA2_83156_c0_seq1:97-1338(-)
MSRCAASPSPSRALYEEAPPRRRRGRGGRGDSGERDERWSERGYSPRAASDAARSRSRDQGRVRRRRGEHRGQEEHGSTRRKRRHTSSRHQGDERDRASGDKGKPERKKRGHEKDREYARKMAAAQQAPMRMAMMQNMMGMPAMQMAMMQQMGQFPGANYMQNMQAMQQHQMMLAQQKQAAKAKKKQKKPATAGADGNGEVIGDSDSNSDSDSDSSSSEDNEVMQPHAAMAAMAAMWPQASAAAGGQAFGAPDGGMMGMVPGAGGPMGGGMNIEVFLSANNVDAESSDRLRALPPHLQQAVMQRGPVGDSRNPSAILLARVREVEQGGGGGESFGYGEDGARGRGGDDDRNPPARRNAKATIENMVRDYRLTPGCAWMLRALPPDKQKLAAKIDPSGQLDPSGYVAEQLKKIV